MLILCVCTADSNFISCSGFWNLLHPQLLYLGRTFVWSREYQDKHSNVNNADVKNKVLPHYSHVD